MTTELEEVQLSWQCLLKIVHHGKEFSPEFVTGQLLGMGTENCLEISDCFPFAANLSDETEQEEYQIETIKSLREANVDTSIVGWYQTCSFDAFVSSSLTEAQTGYQSTIPGSIVLIIDVSKVNLSCPIVRAFQVRQSYHKNFLLNCACSKEDKFDLIFKELSVKISLSILDKLFLKQESDNKNVMKVSPISSVLEHNKFASSFFSNLVECVDETISEHSKLQYFLRNLVKHSQNSSNRNKKNDSSVDYLSALKNGNEANLSTLCHNICQVEQFERFLGKFCESSEHKVNLN